MKKYLTILFLLPAISANAGKTLDSFGQKLYNSSLIDGLSLAYTTLRIGNTRIETYKNYNTSSSYIWSKKDSIPLFFENLITSSPNNPEPYILRSEFIYFEMKQNDPNYLLKQVEYLNIALKIEPENKHALYNLGNVYYKDFMYPRERYWISEQPDTDSVVNEEFDSLDSLILIQASTPKHSTYKSAGDSALKYFLALWKVDNEQRDLIYFPISQLEYYIKKEKNTIKLSEGPTKPDCYFPNWYFVNRKENWESDTTINYLESAEDSKRTVERITHQLADLQEPFLYTSILFPETIKYRFTWLRSFDHPISIRIEKSLDGINLYWKIGKGKGGYKPKGIKNPVTKN